MATTVTIQPTGVAYRYESSSYWGNAQRLWDGDLSSAPTSQKAAILLKLDFSFLPSGARITQMTVRYYAKRGGSSLNALRLLSGSSWGTTTNTEVCVFNVPLGTYNTAEYHNATVQFGTEENTKLFSNEYQKISIPYSISATGYELYLDVTYEESAGIPIFNGDKQATEIHVGDKKATAVYVGTTKVL